MDNDNNIFENEEITIINPARESRENNYDDEIFTGKPVYAEEAPARTRARSDNSVSKRFVVIMMILTMIISSALSAFIATKLASSSHTYQNLSSSSLDKATGSKLTVAEIVAKNQDAVVEIRTKVTSTSMFGQSSTSEGAGSGVIVKEDGYIVTNNHVIDGASSITVTLHNGKVYSATLVGTDPDNDVAVIKISENNLTVAEIGDSAALNVGDLTVAIGNPLGTLGGTATTGIVSALERRLTIDQKTLNLIQTDASINPGNSGGGLFNGAGELVGIVVAKSSGTGIEGLGFALPINNIAEVIDELITNGKVSTKPVIGITIQDVSESQAESSNLNGSGVYIAEVTSAEAKEAGLTVGDKLLKIDGKTFTSSSDFIARVKEHKVGDTVELVIERDGKEITIKTTLIASSSN